MKRQRLVRMPPQRERILRQRNVTLQPLIPCTSGCGALIEPHRKLCLSCRKNGKTA